MADVSAAGQARLRDQDCRERAGGSRRDGEGSRARVRAAAGLLRDHDAVELELELALLADSRVAASDLRRSLATAGLVAQLCPWSVVVRETNRSDSLTRCIHCSC